MLEVRRQTYVHFLGAADARILTERTGRGHADDEAQLERALGGVTLEGPPDVTAAAENVLGHLRRHASPDELDQAKRAFVLAAQQALSPPP
ncbi:hypothetical protein EOT10_21090 [Streptomyces antnestii]|uniref:Uncharacterized protein n=1 Tax=Streptomyces antnestii TaxID=2494256 RepID=A0A437PL16_9ACTN|nr:hypothetical protein [Streptomyces sp. San01]RVU22963.1 hypothetical protein EOT10_21090 [Streptomyces sp. San01]